MKISEHCYQVEDKARVFPLGWPMQNEMADELSETQRGEQ